jgi:cysteine synthase A
VSPKTSIIDLIGNTPLLRLNRASDETGCEILGKAEFLNPGGSIKDRAALGIIRAAEASGELRPGGTIVEGTAGNTGIGLAMVGAALGYRVVIVFPRTQSQEKKDAIRLLGARLIEVDAVPYANPAHYARYSGQLAAELNDREPNGAIWANQFDNIANRDFHASTTAQEIWTQTNGEIDGFICSVGSGGTLGGVSRALKAHEPSTQIGIADPGGAALYGWYHDGELKAEGSSITEGIGQSRVTGNLTDVIVDRAYRVSDEEALPLLFDLVEQDGLCLGGSSGVNIAGAIRMARDLGPGHRIVTILCDHGARYQSKLYNPDFLHEMGLPVPTWLTT